MRYRKKPVVIDAREFTGYNSTEIEAWMLGYGDRNIGVMYGGNELVVYTQEGSVNAKPGDMIIRGVKGEYYPCKPDIFAKTYEEVDADTPLTTLEDVE